MSFCLEAMKSSKADGAKHTQMNATSGETGPLFPRLHVSETEKAGPRAPPRNKMALFEQFTVPSHRFVQPNRTSTSTLNQKQQFVPNDYRYPYAPYYIPSSVPYSNMNHGITSDTQPSHGISSCVTSSGGNALVTDQQSQGASRSQTVEKSVGVSRATTKEDGSSILSSLLERKAKVASADNVLVQSLPRARAKDVQGLCYATSGGSENRCNRFDSVESVERPIITNVTDRLQQVMSTVEGASACPVVEFQSCGAQEGADVNGRMKAIDNVHLQSVTLKPSAEVLDKQNHVHLLTAPGQSCQQPVCIDAVIKPDKVLSKDLLLHANDLAEGSQNNDLWASGKKFMTREEQSPSPSGNSLIDNAQTTFTIEQVSGPPPICKDTQKRCCLSDGERGDSSAGALSADSLPKDKGESTGESKNNQIGSNGVSELSEHGAGLRGDSDYSPSSVLAAQAFRPKDVIRAVGQQQFWKARKALLRQQRIFSDQVFQLHKLIKVQQLLAETPDTFIDEEMPFGAMDECATSPTHCNISEKEHGLGEKVHNAGSCFEERTKCQANEAETKPEMTENPECCMAVGVDGVGWNPYLPPLSRGGISAWGYPSVGMGQWMGPIAARGRPSVYQPFAGAFPPGVPFGGLFGSAMLGPVSPLLPFGIPYSSGQRLEPWEEMSSNHGPAAGLNHQATTAMGHTANHMANSLSGAWHFLQYSNQRSLASVSEKDVPTGSGASINNQRPAKSVGSSGIHYPWGQTSHTGWLNSESLENSAHQSENSSPSTAPGSKFKSLAGMPSTPVTRKADTHYQEAEHPAQNANMHDLSQTSSFKRYEVNRAGGREEANKTALRWLKRQGAGQVPFSEGHLEETSADRSPEYSGNALDLFPLVPSLSPDGQGGPKQAREHWQGRVIKAVPHPAVAASQSAAGILLSLQQERQR